MRRTFGIGPTGDSKVGRISVYQSGVLDMAPKRETRSLPLIPAGGQVGPPPHFRSGRPYVSGKADARRGTGRDSDTTRPWSAVREVHLEHSIYRVRIDGKTARTTLGNAWTSYAEVAVVRRA